MKWVVFVPIGGAFGGRSRYGAFANKVGVGVLGNKMALIS